MVAFSSYADVATVKCPNAQTSPLKQNITTDILRRVNWLLNNYYNSQLNLPTQCTLPMDIPVGTYQNAVPSVAGTYGPISKYDMQSAVWTLTGARATCAVVGGSVRCCCCCCIGCACRPVTSPTRLMQCSHCCAYSTGSHAATVCLQQWPHHLAGLTGCSSTWSALFSPGMQQETCICRQAKVLISASCCVCRQ